MGRDWFDLVGGKHFKDGTGRDGKMTTKQVVETGRDGTVGVQFFTGRDGEFQLDMFSRRDGAVKLNFFFFPRRDGTVALSFHDGTRR